MTAGPPTIMDERSLPLGLSDILRSHPATIRTPMARPPDARTPARLQNTEPVTIEMRIGSGLLRGDPALQIQPGGLDLTFTQPPGGRLGAAVRPTHGAHVLHIEVGLAMNGLLKTLAATILACAAITVHGKGGGEGGNGNLDENWNRFEHYQRFELSREQLRERWPVLHKRDLEPFPDAPRIQVMAADLGREPPQDPQTVAEAMQDAWRAYHAGRFHDAYRLARAQGPYGYYLAMRSWAAYAGLLAPDDRKRALLEQAARRINASPQTPSVVRHNDYWVQGLVLGQYSREVSIAQARAENIPTRVRKILDWTLQRRPRHAQAWAFLGAYHADIIHRGGWMLARMSYGANAADALDAFTRALELAPNMAIAYGEAALGLRRIDAGAYSERIRRYTEQLRELEPLDAEDFLTKRRSLRLLGESP